MGEPYRFVGPQGTSSKFGPNKGVMRNLRESKRQEAEQRQKKFMKDNQRLVVQTEALDANGMIELNPIAAYAASFRHRSMAGQMVLDHLIEVRVLVPKRKKKSNYRSCLSKGLRGNSGNCKNT